MEKEQEILHEVFQHLRGVGVVHTQTDFADAIGVKRPGLSAALNGNKSYLTKNLFKKIHAAFPGVFNLEYLLKGEGQLLAGQEETAITTYQPSRGRPYYNVDFAAGFDIMINDQTVNPDYFIDFRPYNDCDVWCNCHGNSMYPTIASGDVVAMKRIIDFRYLINGEIYGIVTSNGLRTIKRVRDNGDTLTLIPDNKEVAEQTIPKSIVTHVYIIKGALKQF